MSKEEKKEPVKGQDSLQNPTWQEVLDEGVRVLSQAGDRGGAAGRLVSVLRELSH